MATSVLLYDTTLRDGTQRAGISLSLEDKLLIAERLDQFGVDYIEGGWPASNPKDSQFFRKIRGRLKNAIPVAFGSTRRARNLPEEDPNLRGLLEAETPAVTLFGKASLFQVERALRLSGDENLELVESSIAFLRRHGVEVFFDAEHFFDGFKANPAYALAVLRAAEAGGASHLVLCDTNGGSLPMEIAPVISVVQDQTRLPLGIHAHNDSGCAVANSLAAVAAGARMVQGTVNGYGERCGNADLVAIWPALVYKMGYGAGNRPQALRRLSHLARFVAEVANLALDEGTPYVGDNAFTHKAGVHVGAVRRDPSLYEHMDPSLVGMERRVLVSELSGRSNLLYLFKELAPDDPRTDHLLERVKEMEHQGYQFEGAEASFHLIVKKALGELPEWFELLGFRVLVNHQRESSVEATVKVRVGEETLLAAAEGDGPVNALDNALRKALGSFFPQLLGMHLVDYKVRVLDGRDGTAATVRVWIETALGEQRWRTVGVSANVLDASWIALTDSMRYALLTEEEQRSGASMPQASL